MSEENMLAVIAKDSSKGQLIDPKDRAFLSAKILKLQEALRKEVQVEFPLNHHFSEGVYGRELTIPKGTLLVGKIHKFRNLNIILKGKLTFFSIDGAMTVEAPYVYVGSPGAKRVIYAHEDSIWMNCHGTKETDLDKIEQEFIAPSFDDVEALSEDEKNLIKEARKWLGLQSE